MTTPIHDFIQQMGLMAQVEGTPRIAGQILGYLIVEGQPRTLAQMTEALKISKASASTNARLLEFKGSVRRVCPVGQRQDAYEAVEEPNQQFLVNLAERFRANAESIRATGAAFPASHQAARARVENFAEFYRKSADFLDEWTLQLADRPASAPTPKD